MQCCTRRVRAGTGLGVKVKGSHVVAPSWQTWCSACGASWDMDVEVQRMAVGCRLGCASIAVDEGGISGLGELAAQAAAVALQLEDVCHWSETGTHFIHMQHWYYWSRHACFPPPSEGPRPLQAASKDCQTTLREEVPLAEAALDDWWRQPALEAVPWMQGARAWWAHTGWCH